MKDKVVLLLFSLFSASAFSGDCILSIDRVPCPGKETNALKPYNGRNPTESKKTSKDPEECLRLARRETKIIRVGDLAQKNVTPTFEGKVLSVVSDEQRCGRR